LSDVYNSNNQPGHYGQDADGQFVDDYGMATRYRGQPTAGGQWPGTMDPAGTSTPLGGHQPDGDSDRLPPFQDDRLTERGGYRQGVGATTAMWNQGAASSWQTTATRTYAAHDGSVVTEYRAERGGVFDGSMGHHNGYYGNDDLDHDKALTDAILAVTSMNTDLSVEKIEIVQNRTLVQ
jgi:hypothetical protein